MDVAQGLRGPANQIGFLLAYGYFRAAQRFFSPEQYRERDIAFVSRVIAASPSAFSVKAYKERTRLRHQKLILDRLGYQPFDAQAEAHLVTEIATMVRAHLKPRLIFRRCIDVLIEKRIQVPGVRRLTDLFRAELSARKSTLVRLVDTHLTPHLRQMLDDLFMQEDGANRYRLTLLKTFSQSAAPGKIKETAADFETLSDMYRQITSVFEGLAIGTEGIRYYAGGVQRSEMFQLQRRSHADRYLHAIAFIADQHHRLQDAMVDLLLSVMQSFETAATRDHKEEVFARISQTLSQAANQSLTDLVHIGAYPVPRINGQVPACLVSDRGRIIERIAALEQWLMAVFAAQDEVLVKPGDMTHFPEQRVDGGKLGSDKLLGRKAVKQLHRALVGASHYSGQLEGRHGGGHWAHSIMTDHVY